jgi:hypothetical protein
MYQSLMVVGGPQGKSLANFVLELFDRSICSKVGEKQWSIHTNGR